MMQPILYDHAASGHAYKVRLLLSLLGRPWTSVEVDIFAPREARAGFGPAVSRFGEVPVLVDGDRTIAQSNAILRHLARGTALLPDTPEIDEWLFWEQSRLSVGVANLREARTIGGIAPDLEAFFSQRATRSLDRLQAHLADRDWLVDAGPTIADISCCGYLYWLAEAELEVARWPAVARWLGRIAALPGWRHPDAGLAP